ncbi:hypothetical protein LguiB_021065 [Lonicera macranthoides]
MDVQASAQKTILHKEQVIARRSANYHPSVWGYQFLKYDYDLTKIDADTEEELEQLKQEVRKMVVNGGGGGGGDDDAAAQQLMLIDVIQQLGVAYHFENEIGEALNNHLQVKNNLLHASSGEGDKINEEDDQLYMVALRFRLLRQHGHPVTCDIFNKFKDDEGRFKESLIKDTRGLLSLYEAAHMRVHGEDILDEALEFTTTHLKQVPKYSSSNSFLASQVVHALNHPIRKSLIRLQARHYIPIYQQDNSHNKTLLRFAKLDFNMLQKVHQRELSHITRWWKELNFKEKLPFARDRLVECYFWAMVVYFEPQYSLSRKVFAKVTQITSVLDDIYDVYGTLEELILLTDAIDRWDASALDQLPEYMRLYYQAFLDVYTEMEETLSKDGTTYRVHYAKDAMKESAKAYFQEAKWYNEGYVPTMEEYMKIALVTSCYKMIVITSFAGMGELVTKETLDWVSNNPLIVRASSVICRLTDDMVGHQFEQERGHVASDVECYMKQHNATKEDAFVEFNRKLTNAWKDLNQECLAQTAVQMNLLERVLNLARVIDLLYKDKDWFTHSETRTKDFITSLLIDSVPI